MRFSVVLQFLSLVAVVASQRRQILSRRYCRQKLPPECLCTINIINCTKANINDTDVFLKITHFEFPRVDTIVFTRDNFGKLPNMKLFGEGVVHRSLTFLDLSHNHIKELHWATFGGMPRLEHLLLNDNEIIIEDDTYGRSLRKRGVFYLLPNLQKLYLENALDKSANITDQIGTWRLMLLHSNLTRLQKLHMDHNGIIFLPDDLFCNLPQLTHLSLAQNNLHSFRPKVECISGLVSLNLSSNNIRYLSSNFTSIIDSAANLEEVDLSGNHFDCTCHLKHFVSWLKDTHRVKDKDQLRCYRAFSNNLVDSRLMDVDPGSLKCSPDGSRHIHGVYIVVALALAGLILFLTCLVYINRRCICQNAKQVRMGTIGGYAQLERESRAEAEFV